MVYPGLAANTAVHLGQQCSRNLDKGYSPHESGCQESCQVSHNPSAKSQHQIIPAEIMLQQIIITLFQIGAALGFLSGRQDKTGQAVSCLCKYFFCPVTIIFYDIFICNQKNLLTVIYLP